jgi:hypothetical protein
MMLILFLLTMSPSMLGLASDPLDSTASDPQSQQGLDDDTDSETESAPQSQQELDDTIPPMFLDVYRTRMRCIEEGDSEPCELKGPTLEGNAKHEDAEPTLAERDAEPMLAKKSLDAALAKKSDPSPPGPSISLYCPFIVLCQSWCYYSSNFYNLVHMVNSPSLVDWAVGTNANSVEFDVRFTHNPDLKKKLWGGYGHGGAEPLISHHGPPCDCACLALDLIRDHVCANMKTDLLFLCNDYGDLTEMFERFVVHQVAAIYFDNKLSKGQVSGADFSEIDVGNAISWPYHGATAFQTDDAFEEAGYHQPGYYSGRIDAWDYQLTGLRLGNTITMDLRGKGYYGVVMIGVADEPDGTFVLGVLEGLYYYTEWAVQRSWIVWESNYHENYWTSAHTVMHLNRPIKQLIYSHMFWNGWPNGYFQYSRPSWKVASSYGVSTCAWWLDRYDFYYYAQAAVVYRARTPYGGDYQGNELALDYVLTWTIDVALVMEEMLEIGIDGMITNNPKQLFEEAAKLGVQMPPRHGRR